jgi:hypothetical protein
MSAAEKLKPAAGVILLRPVQPRGFEVFLAHQPDKQPFLGERNSFPGGSIQKSDRTQAILRRCRGLSGEKARKILGAHLAPPEAQGFWIAAIRTLFEDVGVLFAITENGEPVGSDRELNARLLQVRTARRDGALDFPALMERENLFCDAAKLASFSHWQRSTDVSRGFEMRFFLAAMRDDQTPIATATETTHGSWLTPDRALHLFSRGELPMAFATFTSLRTLADFGSVKSVLKEFQPELT